VDIKSELDLAVASLKKTTSGYTKTGTTGTNWLEAFKHIDNIYGLLTPPPPMPKTTVIGIATGWGPNTPSDLSAGELETYMRFAVDLGVTEVRMDYSYPNSAPFNRAAIEANKQGLNLVPLMTHLRDGVVADSVDAVLTKFGAKVSRIEVGNEVNGKWAWGVTPDPVLYTSYLKTAYTRCAKRCPIIFAGLAQYMTTNADTMNALEFYTKAKNAGAVNYCDGIGWHPYSDDTVNGMGLNDDIYALMGKPLYLTESGVSTYNTSEEVQRDKLIDRIKKSQAADYIAGFYIYSLMNHSDTLNGREDKFGIINRDFTKKLAFDAIAALL